MEEGYYFTSNLFKITKGEDQETNPLCYGKSLAEWLCLKFSELGYDAEVIPEDWGWCVMCEYGDYLLWVGCGIMQDEELFKNYDENSPPKGNQVTWHVFSQIELPFLGIKSLIKKWTGKLDMESPLKKLNAELEKIIKSETGISIC